MQLSVGRGGGGEGGGKGVLKTACISVRTMILKRMAKYAIVRGEGGGGGGVLKTVHISVRTVILTGMGPGCPAPSTCLSQVPICRVVAFKH